MAEWASSAGQDQGAECWLRQMIVGLQKYCYCRCMVWRERWVYRNSGCVQETSWTALSENELQRVAVAEVEREGEKMC